MRCETGGKKETVRAGKMAAMTEDGQSTVEKFSAADLPSFVMEEIEDSGALSEAVLDDSGINVTIVSCVTMMRTGRNKRCAWIMIWLN